MSADPAAAKRVIIRSLVGQLNASSFSTQLTTLHYLLPSSLLPALDILESCSVEQLDFAGRSAVCLGSARVLLPSWTCSCASFFESACMIAPVAEPLYTTTAKDDQDMFTVLGECPHVVAAYIALHAEALLTQKFQRRDVDLADWLAIIN